MNKTSSQWLRFSAIACALTLSIFVIVGTSETADAEDQKQKVFAPIGPFTAPKLDTSSIKNDNEEEETTDAPTNAETASTADGEQDKPENTIVPVVTSSPDSEIPEIPSTLLEE